MKSIIYIVLFVLIPLNANSQDFKQTDSLAQVISTKVFTDNNVYGRFTGSEGPCEYVTKAYYDSISVQNKNESLRLYYLVLSYIKHDSLITGFLSYPGYYCAISTSGSYYLVGSDYSFRSLIKAIQPIDTPAKAEFLGIVYAKCVKGVCYYSANDTNYSVSTVLRDNEYVITISEKKYDSYWNDLIKKEVLFRINKNGEYSFVGPAPDENKE